MARLQEFYRDTVAPGLMDQFQYKSAMQIPRPKKDHS